MTTALKLGLFALFLNCAVAIATPAESFSLLVDARVFDSSRTQVVQMAGRQENQAMNKVFRLSASDLQIELTPKERKAEAVTFAYRVTKKGALLSLGEMEARVGQKSHMLVGQKKGGHLVQLAVRLPGKSVPYGREEPRLLRGQFHSNGRYVPL
jgi:hypothetical protein